MANLYALKWTAKRNSCCLFRKMSSRWVNAQWLPCIFYSYSAINNIPVFPRQIKMYVVHRNVIPWRTIQDWSNAHVSSRAWKSIPPFPLSGIVFLVEFSQERILRLTPPLTMNSENKWKETGNFNIKMFRGLRARLWKWRGYATSSRREKFRGFIPHSIFRWNFAQMF